MVQQWQVLPETIAFFVLVVCQFSFLFFPALQALSSRARMIGIHARRLTRLDRRVCGTMAV